MGVERHQGTLLAAGEGSMRSHIDRTLRTLRRGGRQVMVGGQSGGPHGFGYSAQERGFVGFVCLVYH